MSVKDIINIMQNNSIRNPNRINISINGQSNSLGVGGNPPDVYQKTYESKILFEKDYNTSNNVPDSEDGKLVQLDYTAFNNRTFIGVYHGVEMSLIDELETKTTIPITHTKVSRGSTSITSFLPSDPQGYGLYQRWVDTINNADSDFGSSEGLNICIWQQYENDINPDANHLIYYQMLNEVFDAVQQGSRLFDYIIIVKTNPTQNPVINFPDRAAIIEQAQIDFVNDDPSKRYLWSWDDIDMQNIGFDGLHYTSQNHIDKGIEIYDVIKNRFNLIEDNL